MNENQVIELMESSKTEKEWNANCDKVKKACNGYPSFWFSKIISSGLASETFAKFGSSPEIRIIPLPPESLRERHEREFQQEDEEVLAAAAMVTLHRFENQELSALNLAVQLQGKVPKENLAFDKALDYKLIREDGSVYDLNVLKRACACEVNARVAAGTFN